MDRRQTLKTLMVGTVAGGATLSTIGCKQEEKTTSIVETSAQYGRTPTEKDWDIEVTGGTYFDTHEMSTIATLCDIILPATETAGSATDAEVPAFVEFIVKDLPSNQLPLRGGLMWLDGEAQKRFNLQFDNCSATQQISIVDDIAYPDPDGQKPQFGPGIKFFSLMRDLTLTGYYTSKIGIKDLGYKGNIPNIWDGVPADVLKDHDVDYDPEWIAKCVDQDKRDVQAEWDDDGNLLT